MSNAVLHAYYSLILLTWLTTWICYKLQIQNWSCKSLCFLTTWPTSPPTHTHCKSKMHSFCLKNVRIVEYQILQFTGQWLSNLIQSLFDRVINSCAQRSRQIWSSLLLIHFCSSSSHLQVKKYEISILSYSEDHSIIMYCFQTELSNASNSADILFTWKPAHYICFVQTLPLAIFFFLSPSFFIPFPFPILTMLLDYCMCGQNWSLVIFQYLTGH